MDTGNSSITQLAVSSASDAETYSVGSTLLAQRNIELLATRLELREGEWYASYRDFFLYSLNQPIVSHSHQKFVGLEALIRGEKSDGSTVMPADLFARGDEAMDAEHRLLERLSRLLHIANFKRLNDFTGWLFINLSPQLIAVKDDAEDLAAALQWAGVPAERVVVEVTEQASYESQGLLEAVERYRQLGCMIAIDDFGAGHSNFERIWMLRPDIVKLDRNMVLRAASDPCIEQMLPRMVELIHQSGSMVLAEGLETVEQALMVWNSGADLGQGYLFGHPRKGSPCQDKLAQQLNNLANQSQRQWKRDWERRRRLYDNFQHHIKQVMQALRAGRTLELAAKTLMRQSRVRRCFLLDDKGLQLASQQAESEASTSSPLNQEQSCHWGRRSYFRHAIEEPDQMHISMPYISVTDGSVCQTLSICFRTPKGTRVLCCDVDPDNPN